MNPFLTLGSVAVLLARTTRAMAHARVSAREWLIQMREMGSGSAPFVVIAMGFFGAVAVVIANSQARKVTGNLAVLGPPFFELIVREFGPLTSALLVAARAGAQISAELSAMAVNEQVEALEMSAGDPLVDLVAPRFLAGLASVPFLCTLGTLSASTSAAMTANYVYLVDGYAFVDPRYVGALDLSMAFVKSLGFGALIPIAACWRGLRARGGAGEVGSATTEGVVLACFGCLALDVTLTLGAFFLQ